ncbi:MAG: DEAD/DEAH box helicase [Thermodesulfovibrionales bacterium]|nr:DEAD/DEAH box helicase [Thermodesulfovibrionales bacterium]
MYKNFNEFGISDKVTVSLSEMGFEEPTPIQKMAIPPVLQGKDIIGQAQTGTGKTAAFGIPLIEQRHEAKGRHPYAIVLAPTRELAVQVSQEINKMGARAGVVSLPIYGGQSIELQIRSLKRGADIVVGTPGRVLDHIGRKTLVLKDIKTVVLDEADEMLNMGFIEDIEKILGGIPGERQTMLFSATMPKEIIRMSKNYMNKPVHVGVDASEMVVAKIKQVFYEVRDEDKIKALTRLLDVEGPALTLVFCHTKKEVDEVAGRLQQMGYPAGAIHGDFTQSHRDEMMRKFKGGDIDILVATDVAARGLDIPDVSHVINFSIPQDPEGYIHRIGRTGRAGKSGIAITFVTPRQYRQLKLIEQSAKTRIKKAKLPSREEVRKAKEEELAVSVEEIIKEGGHTRFYAVAKRLFEKYSHEEVSAAALSMLLDTEDIQEIEEPVTGYAGQKKDSVRLFMTIGKMDKIKVGDIVKSISAEAGIPERKVSNIALFDKFSFVEVPADLADRVISAINDRIIKGRKVRIQHAKKRERR